MMHDWSEQEEKMLERFPRRNDNNLRRTNDNCTDKNQRDYSSSSRKLTPDDLVVAVDRPPRGRKTTMQEQFKKFLQKKCPWHPGANHAAIDCYNYDSSSTCKLGILFVSVKYVLVSVKLVCVM
jgi:hypothetical protein